MSVRAARRARKVRFAAAGGMFDGLDLKAHTALPKKESAVASTTSSSADGMVSGFSFLNAASVSEGGEPPAVMNGTSAQSEKRQPSILDLEMTHTPSVPIPPVAPIEPSTSTPKARRPIVKKKKAKRVGYAREEDEVSSPRQEREASPEPVPEPVAVSEPVAASVPGPVPTPQSEAPEPSVPVADSVPPIDEARPARTSSGQSEAELWSASVTEVAPAGAIPDVPDYSAELSVEEKAAKPAVKEKKAGMLQRMFGPKHSKSKPVEERASEAAFEDPAVGKDEEPEMAPTKAEEDAPKEERMANEQQPAEAAEDTVPESQQKQKTPEEEFMDKISGFVSGTTDLCFRLSEHERRAAVRAREKASFETEQSKFDSELKEKVLEQERLAEAEEYERADSLTTEVESLKQEMALRAAALRDLALEVDRAEREMGSRRLDQLRAAEEMATWLRSFEAAQRDALKSANRDAKVRREAAARRVAAEAERLSMERAHVERDAAHVAEEFERMEKLIEAQTAGDASRRDELSRDKAAKELEIDELKMRLAAAQAERDVIDDELREIEGKIGNARAKFERQLQRLEQRDKMVKASAADCDAELAALEREKEAIELASQHAERLATERANVADAAALELDVSRRLAAAAAVWQHADGQGNDSDEAGRILETELQALRCAVAEAEEAFHDAAKQLRELEASRASLRAERSAIDERIPQLESAKKAAAAARQYKEAGALAKEAKQWAAKRSELNTQLERIEPPLNDAQATADDAASKHATAKADLADRERDADVQLLRALRSKANQLKALQNRFANDAKASKLAAAAASLVRVELANVSVRADDLCRDRQLQDYDEVDDEPLLDIQQLDQRQQDIDHDAEIPHSSDQQPSLKAEDQAEDQPEDQAEDRAETQHPSPLDNARESPGPNNDDDDDQKPPDSQPTDTDNPQPDKADRTDELPQLEAKVADINVQIDAAVERDDFDTAEALSSELALLEAEISEIRAAADA